MTEPSVGDPLSMHDPRRVGPWTIHSRLGAGGMGVVFYASSPEHQGIALKVIHPGLLDAPGTRDRFRREVAILSSVRDAHISEFLAADLESEPAWLAIEYVSGPTLRDEVAAHGPLSEDAWWALAQGMAQALAVLDTRRITHRDLKPGNVILSQRGPELIDFGIAHPEDATSLTATGLVTGSPAWLSPEQATLDPIGPPSDIFALGSMLAYAATGRPPFGEGAAVAVLMSIATKEPELEGIDPARAALLRRMMAKDPTRRPTASQVLDWIRGHDQADSTLTDGAAPTSVRPAVAPTPAHGLPTQVAPVAVPPALGTPETPPPPPPPPPTPAATPTRVAQPAPAPLPAPPVRTLGAVGPRTAAARQRRARRRRIVVVVLGALALIVAGWLAVQSLDSATTDNGSNSQGGSQPGSASAAPPAPGSDQLRAGPWLLERYALDNRNQGLTIAGTVRNTGDQPASADLTAWVYLGSDSLGSVSATVTDVPAGEAVQVTMTGDAIWTPGDKTLLLEAG